MSNEEIKERLNMIIKDFSTVIDFLKIQNGKINSDILDLIDQINKLSVEI